jgi:hypothetical protein
MAIREKVKYFYQRENDTLPPVEMSGEFHLVMGYHEVMTFKIVPLGYAQTILLSTIVQF